MVLHAHFKKYITTLRGSVFDVPSETPLPPDLVKDQSFPDFFLLPSLSEFHPILPQPTFLLNVDKTIA